LPLVSYGAGGEDVMTLLEEARRRTDDELRLRMRAEAATAAAETAATTAEDQLRSLRLQATHTQLKLKHESEARKEAEKALVAARQAGGGLGVDEVMRALEQRLATEREKRYAADAEAEAEAAGVGVGPCTVAPVGSPCRPSNHALSSHLCAIASPPHLTLVYNDEKVANRDTKVWHFEIENGY
jgi:hypothetical protein